ncbi:type VI secretion system protein ImpH [Pseudoduganella lurida]|uniref:Type VI secretion system protein ImpH n=1 Tax=Pseudoduganella lurida TaxID=1036180 RepID=A0A562RET0_9BURK|nr:type VI secretion system baseplate subunit TssG [Pseudoduganella lurida]TWI67528.1 type VI secretion system protein ImpH [Pseudoduganella lurida]
MSTAQRNDCPELIGQICDAPGRYSFFQAVELLLGWLAQCHDVPRRQALDRLLRFENSRDLTFPTSDLGAVDVHLKNSDPHVAVTALFMGFTGTHGALPLHYTERIARNDDGGTLALLDIFSNRFVRHFHAAWRKHRPELPSLDEGADDLRPLLMALSGNITGTSLDDSVVAYYTGALQQRPASSAMLQSVICDYFQLPVTIETSIGYWHILAPHQLARVGTQSAKLDGGLVLGPAIWRRDARIRIRFGPLDRETYDSFLPDGERLPKLLALIAMFHMPGIDAELVLVLSAAEVQPITLAGGTGGAARLGYHTFLCSAADRKDCETRYLLPVL